MLLNLKKCIYCEGTKEDEPLAQAHADAIEKGFQFYRERYKHTPQCVNGYRGIFTFLDLMIEQGDLS